MNLNETINKDFKVGQPWDIGDLGEVWSSRQQYKHVPAVKMEMRFHTHTNTQQVFL